MRLSLLSRVRSRLRGLVGAESGQVALTFGLALIPMVLAIGCGVDISRAVAAKSRLVDALDATALAVAGTPTSASANITAVAHAYFYANYAGSDIGTVTSLSVVPTGTGQGYQLSATSRVSTAFMSVAGLNDVEVSATTEVVRAARGLEMVLVLDTTASMQGPRITALKSAATNLINTIVINSSVRLAIVPFARYVNIGTFSRSIAGVSVPPDSTTCTTVNESVTTCTGTEQYQTTCTRRINPRPGTCTVDGAQVSCTVYDIESYPCTKTRGTGCTTTTQPTQSCTSQTWNGCVGSRPPPLNASDGQFPGTSLPGLMNVLCGQPVTLLTDSVATLRNAISALSVSGNTYIPAGLQLGWHVLTPRTPFTQATPYGSSPQPRRVMLLMTDGTNSLSLTGTGPLHTGTSRVAADQLTRDICSNIKQDGIEIFSIAFEVTDTATKQMLEQCSSGVGFFYDASDATQLIQAFEAIAVGVTELRITK